MFLDADLLFAATQFAGFSIAILAAILSIARRGHNRTRYVLAALFLALAASELSSVTEIVILQAPQMFLDVIRIASFVATFAIAPLLVQYVRHLIVFGDPPNPMASLGWHMPLPIGAAIVGVLFLILDVSEREGLFGGGRFDLLTVQARAVGLALVVLEFLIHIQWLVCVAWIFRAQLNRLKDLRQHFASTQGMELRWVSLVAGAIGVYTLISLTDFLAVILDHGALISEQLDSLLILIVVTILALWGLRPSIGVARASQEIATENRGVPKYQKSALGVDQAERIARKLQAAMRDDKQYRNPNLTLSALSKHIGVTPNYVSQTLNERVGQSFFEFVNSWRVEEAIPLLLKGENTVLTIAYEVGFNSRSSFYTAFKVKTGQTPSGYKKTRTSETTVMM
ncbi:helix-turn-helix transcriptional regulator [Yoonia sp. GPGPB17]|uniref:helix-turn-helix domain-containing protein n=1 Tax=Yoonia sp. GPGPB17 TaxID=3026147 RepID=UPI0030BF176E